MVVSQVQAWGFLDAMECMTVVANEQEGNEIMTNSVT
jgi:hypothetical protein